MPKQTEELTIKQCLQQFGQHQAFLLGNKGYLAEGYLDPGKRAFSQPETGTNGSSNYGSPIMQGPPWEIAPAGYVQFDDQNVLAALPIVGAPEATVLTVIVPRGMDGVIKWYSCNFSGGGFVNGSGDIIWRIRNNGRAVRNFDNIRTERGTPDRPRELKPGIRVYSENVLTFTVTHAANVLLGGEPVICSLAGYFYPSMGS